jgi:tRNA threonylcarbamoyladenosine biosynthesis protein TsaB
LKILALDTSERQFSVAAILGDTPLAELVWNRSPEAALGEPSVTPAPASTGVAVDLFPMLTRLLAQVGWSVRDVELVAAAKGPGSFTGLRTGIVAAKTIAFARKIFVYGANTLEAQAIQLGWHLESKLLLGNTVSDTQLPGVAVHCVINAQRQQLFAAKFRLEAGTLGELRVSQESTSRISNRENWLADLVKGDWVTGTGLNPLLDSLKNLSVNVAPKSLWPSMASTIGRIAYREFLAGRQDDLWTLEPVYFRPSYAEDF